ncbi:UNVERIFIED_CONTAM: putative response regulatory protein, partial [Trichonephila clavipes]
MLELLDNQPHIIFTTAFDEYALKAFEKNAVDYLLKPIRPDRFQKAIDKFKASFQTKSSPKIDTEKLQESMEEESSLERITILIDDEPLARSMVLEYLQQYPEFQVLAECNDGFEGVKAIHQHQPDL